MSQDVDLEEEEEDEDQVADVKSPSQSNHSASNHTTPKQTAQSGGYDDMLSFDAFSPPQNTQQPQSAQSSNDEWGNFGDENGNTTANGGGNVGGDNAQWDPFASSPEQAAQPVQQQQQQQNTAQSQGQSMGWDNTLWDDKQSGTEHGMGQ